MSNSYKKNAGWSFKSKFFKNYSNRRLRRIPPQRELQPVGNHSNYKRYNDPWDICDMRFIYHYEFEEYKKERINWVVLGYEEELPNKAYRKDFIRRYKRK